MYKDQKNICERRQIMNARVWARHTWRIQKQTFTYWLNAIARIFIKMTTKQNTCLKEGKKKNTLNEYQNHFEIIACTYKKIDEGQNDHRLDRKICTKWVKHLVFFRHWCKPEMWCFWISILLKIGISCVPHITRDGHVQF